MKIVILTVGSRGDVQPYIALGLGLVAAGYDVVFATHVEFEEFVRGYGLAFEPVRGNPFLGLNAGAGQTFTQSDTLTNQQIEQRMEQAFADWMASGVQAARDADALIYSQLCFVGYYVAEKLGIPAFMANHSPITPTMHWPTIYARQQLPLGPLYNRLTHVLDQQLFWQPLRPRINRIRKQVLELPPLPFLGPYGRMHRQRLPILNGYSPAVLPKPADWGAWIYVTGYWFLERPANWQPPAEVLHFLQSGPPPIFLGLGSVANSNPVKVTRMVLSAIKRAGQRVVVNPGRVDLSNMELPEQSCVIGPMAYSWLFPQVAGVICHGGPGTLSDGFRAGVPSMGIPFFGDQFFWSERAHAIGVSPRPLPYDKLTEEHMLAAVTAMVHDQELRARAAELGRVISAEDGVGNAVKAVQQHLAVLSGS